MRVPREPARLLTIAEVAEHVRLRPEAVYRAIRRGELQASKLGGRLRVRPSALDAWIEGQRVERPAPAPPPLRPRQVRERLDEFKWKVTP